MALNDFLGTIKSEGMQLNKPFLYDVTFTFGAQDDTKELLRLLCHTANIPGFEVSTQPTKIYGLSYEMPYELLQQPLSFTFYVDKSFRIPELFNSLKEKTFLVGEAGEGDHSPFYRDNYKFDGQILIYDTDNITQTIEYKFKDAFIKSVQDLGLSYGAQNQFQQITISVLYERMYMERKSGQTATGASNAAGYTPAQNGSINPLLGGGGLNSFPLNFDSMQCMMPAQLGKLNLSGTNIPGGDLMSKFNPSNIASSAMNFGSSSIGKAKDTLSAVSKSFGFF